MQRFKNRVQLLTEKRSGTFEHGDDDSLSVTFDGRSARFVPISYTAMNCSIDLVDGARTFRIDKSYVFDIVDRLASAQLASTLRDYPRPPILQLDDFINDEHGGPALQELRERVAADPSLTHADLGGNRILVEFYRGVLILCDDLMTDGTNVVDL